MQQYKCFSYERFLDRLEGEYQQEYDTAKEDVVLPLRGPVAPTTKCMFNGQVTAPFAFIPHIFFLKWGT